MSAVALGGRAVPARARELAGRLAALFERDVEIVGRLNDAHRRLRDANERLWSGLAPDAFGLVYDGAAFGGQSPIAKLLEAALGGGRPEAATAVLVALQQTHWAIRRAWRDGHDACEERRQLAVEVGELSWQLTAVLCAAGFSEEEALRADVHALSGAAR